MAAKSLQLEDRDIDLAQFTLVLGLESTADRFIELWEELINEEFALPRWAWIRRRRKREWQKATLRLYQIFHEYAREQDQAHTPS